MVLFAMFLDTILDTLEVLREEASSFGLPINWSKTKVQSLSDFLAPPPGTINDESVDTVNDFI